MIVVRWLGAFGHASSLEASIRHELTTLQGKQVAAEPLFDGRSRLSSNAEIGLLVDQSISRLIAAYGSDAWTKDTSGGRVKAHRTKQKKPGRSWDSLQEVGRSRPRGHYKPDHGEVTIQGARYSALVARWPRKKLTIKLATELAAKFGLPLVDTQGRILAI